MALLWLLLLVFRHWFQVHETNTFNSSLSILDIDLWLDAALVLIGAGLMWRCVSAESPSNTDTFSLTRPVGQAALWCGKLLFMFIALILPALLVASVRWHGFGLSVEQISAMSAAVVLAYALLGFGAATLTALASSARQMLALAVLAVVAAGVWLAMQEKWTAVEKITTEEQHRALCGSLVAAVVTLLGLWAAWWLVTVPRRRLAAACLLLATLILAPFISQAWKTDWITLPGKNYANAAKLAFKVGKADPADKTPGRAFWPTLHLTGLGKDEVASIIEFAPILENKPWPPEGSYSDLEATTNGYDYWLHYEHTRALFKHYPPTTLWRQDVTNLYNGRKTLPEVLQSLRLKREEAMQHRWRLRLVIHEMKRLTMLPYRQFWSQENSFLIRPGLRLECNPFAWIHDAWEMHGRAHRVSSALLPVDAFRSAIARERELGDNFFLVLEDQELRENRAISLPLGSREGRYVIYRGQSLLWQTNENQGFEVRLWHPREQDVILQRSHDEWINQQDASLWHTEERGIVELELTPEQMAQVLPEPKPKEVAKP
jgi:hypothetical protein